MAFVSMRTGKTTSGTPYTATVSWFIDDKCHGYENFEDAESLLAFFCEKAKEGAYVRAHQFHNTLKLTKKDGTKHSMILNEGKCTTFRASAFKSGYSGAEL